MFRFKSVFLFWLSIAILIFLCIVALYALGLTEAAERAYQPNNFPQTPSFFYPNFSYPIHSLYNGDIYRLMNNLPDYFSGDYIWHDLSEEAMLWDSLYYEFSPYNSMLWNPGLPNFPALGLGLWYTGFPSQFQGGYFGSGTASNLLYTRMESLGIYPSLSESETKLVGKTNLGGVNIYWFIMNPYGILPYHLQLAYAFPAIKIPWITLIGTDGTCGNMYIDPVSGMLFPFFGE